MEALAAEDKLRIDMAINRQLEVTKRRRTLLRSKRKKFYDTMKEKEGQTYGAGCF